jgi:hypothetical protein
MKNPKMKARLRSAMLRIACPKCSQAKLVRRYLPAAGPMNGSVRCERCRFQAPYLEVLAAAIPEDPLPETMLVPRPPPLAPLLDTRGPVERLRYALLVMQRLFSLALGLRHRWRFA